jgi:hypothetical protein
MRLRRVAQGGHTNTTDLSFGLNVTTGCLDVPLPYSLATTPLEARPAIAQAALAAIPPATYAPFDGQTVLRSSYVDDCEQWPNDLARPAFTGPLPDVPALLLGGRLDLRTPIENARATATRLPHASVVSLAGNGHDATDSDLTGCIARAYDRFLAGRTVGNPCKGQNNGFRPLPQPPRRSATSARRPASAAPAGASCSACSTPSRTRSSPRPSTRTPRCRCAAAACAAGASASSTRARPSACGTTRSSPACA